MTSVFAYSDILDTFILIELIYLSVKCLLCEKKQIKRKFNYQWQFGGWPQVSPSGGEGVIRQDNTYLT